MSRTTQYIGLNKRAQDYVDKYALKKETFVLTKGMFEEDVIGTRYYMPVPYPELNVNKELVFEEVIQLEPWSSGPMIFTCLKEILTKQIGQIIDDNDFIFQWVISPERDKNEEYDYEQGIIYL